MCGRFAQAIPPATLQAVFHLPGPLTPLPPNWNLAPKQQAAVIRRHPKTGKRVLTPLVWGLVPSWAQADHPYSTINAKAEELAHKPFYKDAWHHARRCLIPATAFYEWQPLNSKQKQPYAIAQTDEQPLAMAGLWEAKTLDNGDILRTFTIITCAPNEALAPFHDRMPVLLPPDTWADWLGETDLPPAQVAELMRPCPNEMLRLWPVDRRVGNVRNNGPELLAPLEV